VQFAIVGTGGCGTTSLRKNLEQQRGGRWADFSMGKPVDVVGFKHGCYFPFHIWDVILPIDELHHFSRWLLHHQPVWMF